MPGTSNRQHRKRRPSPIDNNFDQNSSNFHYLSENNLLFANEIENKSYNFDQQQISHNFEQNRLKQNNFCHFPNKHSNNNYSVTAVPPIKQQPSAGFTSHNFQNSFTESAVEARLNHSIVNFF